MSQLPDFSEATKAKAAELADPDQVGSFAWHVLGTKGDIRRVHTDARYDDHAADFNLTFLLCSCPAGKNNSNRTTGCSHALRVLQSIYLAATQGETSG